MEIQELTTWLEGHDEWDYRLEDDGIVIRNARLDTYTRCTLDAVERNDLSTITSACSQGRDVEHVTRVTGYFSKVSGWNKGKTAELRDRHRSTI